jgi:histidinol dehydrogenase
VIALAETEGLDAHAESIRIRLAAGGATEARGSD